MAGRIQRLVANIVAEGVRRASPDAFSDPALLHQVLSAGEEGVPLRPYRRLLDQAMAHDAGLALLRCGEPIRELSHPLVFVLLNSDAPRLVIEKEARLAAFFHSRHRVQIEDEQERSIDLLHVGPPGEPPEPPEDLAALGQHIPIFEEIGCRGLRVRLPGSEVPERWVYDRGRFEAPGGLGSYARWHLEWDDYTPTRKPMPGLDETLLAAISEAELDEDSSPVAQVERVVRRDLSRTWRVGEVAEALGMSARTLQRALSDEGERYSDVLDKLRNHEAARLLRTTSFTATEIGYVCGFADSAHFSRSFKKRFGKSPTKYREVEG